MGTNHAKEAADQGNHFNPGVEFWRGSIFPKNFFKKCKKLATQPSICSLKAFLIPFSGSQEQDSK